MTISPSFILTIFLLVQGLPPLLGPLIPNTGGKVTGVVRRADTRQPIPSAQVAVVAAGTSPEAAMTRAVVTDRDGRFSVSKLEPGKYIVVAQAEGYYRPSNDPAAANYVIRDVNVQEGQEGDVGLIELVPAAAIRARSPGPGGRPVRG